MSSVAPPSRTKLLDAALRVLRERGYNATTVDDLCAAAGVSKGAFFHAFKTKEDLAVAAADYWSATTEAMFDAAAFHAFSDPLDRVFGYIDLRAALIAGGIPEFTCLVGTLTQEIYLTHPRIRDACGACIGAHAAKLEADIAEALSRREPIPGLTAQSLALHAQAVLQGAFVLAKASGDPGRAVDSVRHLRRYFEFLFNRSPEEETP